MRGNRLPFLSILVIAFLFRWWGIWFDLPHIYTTEEYKVVNYALRMGARKNLNPEFFQYPSLYLYFTLFVSGVIFVFGKIFGFFSTAQDFGYAFLRNPGIVYLPMRFFSSVWSTLCVMMTYYIGKEMYNNKVGLISALFMTFIPSILISSHEVRPSMPSMFFCMVSFLLFIKFYKTQQIKKFYLSSVFLGIATSIYYPAGFMLLCYFLFFLYIVLKTGYKNYRESVLAIGLFVLSFLVGTPYMIFDYSTFLRGVFTAHAQEVGKDFLQHFKILINFLLFIGHNTSVTPFLGILCFCGAGYVLWNSRIEKVLLLFLPLSVYIFCISLYRYPGTGYLFYVVPLFIILGSKLLNDISDKSKYLCYVILLICLLPSVIETVLLNYRYSQKDVRTIAKEWIEKNIPYGSKILVDRKPHSPAIRETKEQLRNQYLIAEKLNHYKKEYLNMQYKLQEENSGYWIYQIYHPPEEIDVQVHLVKEAQKVQDLIDVSLGFEYLRKKKIQYIIVNSWDEAYALSSSNELLKNFYINLRFEAKLIKEFKPGTKLHPGPIIWIFQL